MKEMEYISYKLEDVVNLKDIKLPEIQRGLVWKPRQIEMLWDSILCKFPIGIFTLIKEFSTEEFNLYDGQQRLNAIRVGYDNGSLLCNTNQILWLDLGFVKEQDYSRQFGFRLTTKAHPWGYRLDGAPYSTEERRKSIKNAHCEDVVSEKSKWDIREFRPIDSYCPIPFVFITSTLCELNRQNQLCKGSFIQTVKEKIKGTPFELKEPKDEQLNQLLDQLYPTLTQILHYEIIMLKMFLNEKTVEENKQQQEKEDESTLLELFFNRINTGGTRISQRELTYSAIKHYWGEDGFANKIKEIAKDRMPEDLFADILFRFYYSENGVIKGPLNAADIRTLRKSGEKAIIKEQLTEDLKEGIVFERVKEIDKWLEDGGISLCFRTEIAFNCPELYILLMKIAQMGFQIKQSFINAMALYLYFCCNNKTDAIKFLYKNICSADVLTIEFIQEKLIDCVSFGWSHPLPSIEDVQVLENTMLANFKEDWDVWNFQHEPYGTHICQMFGYNNKFRQLSMLRIVERDAFNKYFRNYNPMCQNLWEDINRPWDNDHIIPQAWGSKSGQYKAVSNRIINSIGNIALIPFEKNRQKQDNANWEFYTEKDNKDKFHIDEKLTKIEDKKDSITDEADAALCLASITISRFFKIYKEFIKLLEPLRFGKLSQNQELRKKILTQISSQHLYVVGDKERQIEDPNKDFAWQQTWVSAMLGNVENDKDGNYYSVTIGLFDGNMVIEVGKRKNPSKSIIETSYKGWWKELKTKTISLGEDKNDIIYYLVVFRLLGKDIIKDKEIVDDIHKKIKLKIGDEEIFVILNNWPDTRMVGFRHGPISEQNTVSTLNENQKDLQDFIEKHEYKSNNCWTAYKYFEEYGGKTPEECAESILKEINMMIGIIQK